MYSDASFLGSFHVERLSGGGKYHRRIVTIHSGGTLIVSKPGGIVCRIVPLANVTHFVAAADTEEDDGGEGAGVAASSHQHRRRLFESLSVNPQGGDNNTSSNNTSSNNREAAYKAAQSALIDATVDGATSARAERRIRNARRHDDGTAPTAPNDTMAWVLLRISHEHDLLFVHIVPTTTAGGGGDAAAIALPQPEGDPATTASRHPPGVRFASLLKRVRSNLQAVPLQVAVKPSCTALRDAADVARPVDTVKPRLYPAQGHVLVPLAFDDFPVPVAPAGSTDLLLASAQQPFELSVEPAFLEHLHRAIRRHASAASQPPLVCVQAPPPHVQLEVSAAFLSAFATMYDEAVPLLIVLQSHLPMLSSFRASQRFWDFARTALQVSRPPQSVVAMLASPHIVAHIDGGPPTATISATLHEWNDIVYRWEADVRSRLDGSTSTEATAASVGGPLEPDADPEQSYWASFVDEFQSRNAALTSPAGDTSTTSAARYKE